MSTIYDENDLALWKECVSPEFGPTEPQEGFEVLAASEELARDGGLVYRAVRYLWKDYEWVDRDEQVIDLVQYHSPDSPQEELYDAWEQFCQSVKMLNIEQADRRAGIGVHHEAIPRKRLSILAAG